MRGLLTAALALGAVLLLLRSCGGGVERKLLYYPTHHPDAPGLTPWNIQAGIIGYARLAPQPHGVWLLLHGNAGQASDRAYTLPHFAAEDAVYILEYPGYGQRPGRPSKASLGGAATEAYRRLRRTYPGIPIGVVGESLGSGPACALAREQPPPGKIVLVVPFDRLSAVAAGHFPRLAVRLLLTEDWDNVEALADYRGPVEIFGAKEDAVIPIRHAQALAAAHPSATFHEIPGGHNDWSDEPVAFRLP